MRDGMKRKKVEERGGKRWKAWIWQCRENEDECGGENENENGSGGISEEDWLISFS